MKKYFLPVLFFFLVSQATAQKYYTYVTDLGPTYMQLAWGTTDGPNTVGRSSPSHGEATLKIAGRTIDTKANSATIADLEPDHEYSYEIFIGNVRIGQGQARTWAENPTKVAFFVIGDYGTGKSPQYKIARAMWDEFQRREKTGNPARFILTTGDNIYGNISGYLLGIVHTGAQDSDWETKFFRPYEPLLARIPFFPTLGNHDGNETESHDDLPAYLDNMPFPDNNPARYYSFDYGNLARFMALDSTKNTESGPARPAYGEERPQFKWMQQEFAKPHPAWIIPYFHHPPFNAGPFHASSLHDLQHWVDLFAASGVKVVFNGHEHNFQMTEAGDRSRGIHFITSGAGGELRTGNVQSKMKSSNIAAWAPQNHFLSVEIDGKTMRIAPISFEEMHIRNAAGQSVKLPITITLP